MTNNVLPGGMGPGDEEEGEEGEGGGGGRELGIGIREAVQYWRACRSASRLDGRRAARGRGGGSVCDTRPPTTSGAWHAHEPPPDPLWPASRDRCLLEGGAVVKRQRPLAGPDPRRSDWEPERPQGPAPFPHTVSGTWPNADPPGPTARAKRLPRGPKGRR